MAFALIDENLGLSGGLKWVGNEVEETEEPFNYNEYERKPPVGSLGTYNTFYNQGPGLLGDFGQMSQGQGGNFHNALRAAYGGNPTQLTGLLAPGTKIPGTPSRGK